MISIRGLEKIFQATGGGLSGLDLTVEKGEWISLLGPSGCGKSTLLRLIAGLEVPNRGELSVPVHRSRMSFVFQEPALLPWLSVADNVILPLTLKGVGRKEALLKVGEWMEKLRISAFARNRPEELSGGLKMRVSLARALSTSPELLLLDEPFAALDEPIRIELGMELRELWKASRPTVLLVTHSITEGLWLSDRVTVFEGRPGRIVLDQRLELGVDRPLSLRGDPRFLAQVERCFGLLKGGLR